VTLATGCGSSQQAQPQVTTAAKTPPPPPTQITRANYDLLVSDPDSYKGAHANIVGQVFQVQRQSDEVDFQMWADPKNSDWNTVVASADPNLVVGEDDYVRVIGTVHGKYKGQNAFGADVTAPIVIADSVRRVSGLAAASPARYSLGRATYTQYGITVTVQRIDFAPDETRALVFLTNNSNAGFSLYDSSAKLVVGGRQYDSTFSSGDYPELSSDLAPGARTSGVMVFPPVSNYHSTTVMHLEGSSDDFNLGDYGTLKWQFTWR
jgi:hypothetical protein